LRLSSRGTNYLIGLNEDGTVDVIVLEGTVQVENLTNTEQSSVQSSEHFYLLGDLLAAINAYRQLAGKPTFPAIPETIQDAINPYGLMLINAMRKARGCFHGGSNGVPSPFDFVKLPKGWSVLGEVLGCPAEPGVWDPKTVARMLWESPPHRRIVFDSGKPSSIGCVWSTAQHSKDTEVMVCLTLGGDKANIPQSPSSPLLIRAGYRLRFSDDGKVLASFKLSPDDYNTILKGPLFSGFASTLPHHDVLYRYIFDTF